MIELSVEPGEHVRISSATGETVFRTIPHEGMPPGMVFIPCGPHANFILHSITHSTGAPDYKWIDVEVTPCDEEVSSSWELLEEEGGFRYDMNSFPCPTYSKEGDTIIDDVLCPLCGCLCDDITVHIRDDRVDHIDNGCSLSAGKFTSRCRLLKPIIREENYWKEIDFAEATDIAAGILADAERPLLFGWSGTSVEAQCIGVHIAEEIGGLIDNCSSICHGPSIIAIQESGHPGCTLGQVKNRADLVIYWGSNPMESHPRHMSRYTTYINGYFRENPASDRILIVVDIRRSSTAEIADEFIQIKPGGDFAVFTAIRAIVRGRQDVIPEEVAGIKKQQLIRLTKMMMNAEFGALFTGIGLTQSPGKYKNVRAAIDMVDELNRHTKFTLTPMRGHWNVYGTNQSFSYLTGFPYAVDYSRGIPYYNPGETSAVDLLLKKEVDACVIIGADPGAHFPRECNEHLADIPVIVIDPFVAMSTALADIHIPVASVGIDAKGTGYRMDAVPLMMRKVLESRLPNDEKVLSDILAKIRGIKGISC